MAIKDLQGKQGKVNIVVEVIEKPEVREFTKFGRTGRVCNAVVKDETGQIKLTLWNEDIDLINVGDKVKIEGGFVNEFRGDLQLTKGKFGKLEVLESTGGSEKAKQEPVAEEPDESEEEAVEEENIE